MKSTRGFQNSGPFGTAIGRAARTLLVLSAVFVLVQSSFAGKKGSDGGTAAYELRVLDGTDGTAADIQQQNGMVEIVGSSYADRCGVYWLLNTAGDTVMSVNLPCAEGYLNGANALNRHGTIAGWQSIADVDNSGRPILWKDSASDPLELSVPSGFVGNALASDVNDGLLVVGNTKSNNGETSIVAWQVAEVEGALVAIDSITVATATQAGGASVNNQGYVAATLDNRAYRWRVVWNPELGDFGGLQVVSTEQLFDLWSSAAGINEAGTVCGSVNVYGGGTEAYAKALDGNLLNLPLLKVNGRREQTENVWASAVNNAGQVVGSADVISQSTGSYRKPAVLWNVGESALELPLQTWSAELYSLDDAGWAVGSERVSGVSLPILLRPTR